MRAVFVSLCLFFSAPILAEQVGIGFVRLAVHQEQFTIDSAWTAEGTLKIPKVISEPRSEFFVRILDNEEQTLFTESAESPFCNEFEYPADDDGTIAILRMPQTAKEITLRFPIFADITTLELIRQFEDGREHVVWNLMIDHENFPPSNDEGGEE